MSTTAIALLSFVSVSLLLVILIGLYRIVLILGGTRAANSFSASGDDVSGFGQRLTRAHANCYENLPAAAAIMLYAIAMEKTAITDDLAFVLLGCRIAQITVHLASTSSLAVYIRFGFFAAQTLIMIFWLMKLFGHF